MSEDSEQTAVNLAWISAATLYKQSQGRERGQEYKTYLIHYYCEIISIILVFQIFLYYGTHVHNFRIHFFFQALIKFQLDTSTELTKRQITKVVMAIGSTEEG